MQQMDLELMMNKETIDMTDLHAANDCELLDDTLEFLERKIKTPDITIIKQKFDRCRATRGTKCVQSMALIGESGSGKSRLCEGYVEESPRYTENGQKIVPVLYASMPEKATSKVMVSRLLRNLTGLKTISGTEENIQGRLSPRLVAAKTEMIILDETQHLTRESSSISIQHAADAIKTIMNDTKIPVVCVGMKSSKTLLTGKTRFKHERQLFRRNRRLHVLAPYEVGTDNWKALIQQYQVILECEVNLTSEDMLKRLFAATGGLFGFLTPLFMEAIEIAGSTKAITQEVLAKAYVEFQPEDTELLFNPFSETLAQVEVGLTKLLNKGGEEA
jgi:thymidine kinase